MLSAAAKSRGRIAKPALLQTSGCFNAVMLFQGGNSVPYQLHDAGNWAGVSLSEMPCSWEGMLSCLISPVHAVGNWEQHSRWASSPHATSSGTGSAHTPSRASTLPSSGLPCSRGASQSLRRRQQQLSTAGQEHSLLCLLRCLGLQEQSQQWHLRTLQKGSPLVHLLWRQPASGTPLLARLPRGELCAASEAEPASSTPECPA